MKKDKLYLLTLVAFILLSGLSSCSKDGFYTHYKANNHFDGTIYDFLKSDTSQFKLVMHVLDKAGLSPLLVKEGGLTFFLPTDESLRTALNKYNVYRKSLALPAVTIDDIDSSSWRYIILPYMVKGDLKLEDFSGTDGLSMKTLAFRQMQGNLIHNNASGVDSVGGETVKFSYPNGSRFVKDWLSALVATPEIITENGILYIIEDRHSLGFNYFISKAKEPQNLYSEAKTFATGSITTPNGNVELWQDKVKKLTAIDSATVETESANLLKEGDGMRLTVLPNDSVDIKPAPWSVDQSIEINGQCHYDPDKLAFVLNYRFKGPNGYSNVSETINYIAESAYIH